MSTCEREKKNILNNSGQEKQILKNMLFSNQNYPYISLPLTNMYFVCRILQVSECSACMGRISAEKSQCPYTTYALHTDKKEQTK